MFSLNGFQVKPFNEGAAHGEWSSRCGAADWGGHVLELPAEDDVDPVVQRSVLLRDGKPRFSPHDHHVLLVCRTASFQSVKCHPAAPRRPFKNNSTQYWLFRHWNVWFYSDDCFLKVQNKEGGIYMECYGYFWFLISFNQLFVYIVLVIFQNKGSTISGVELQSFGISRL